MAVIEGIGDEVVAVMLGLLVMLLLMIAWNSTGVSDQPFVRTAVLVITRCCHRANPNVQASNATSGTGPPLPGDPDHSARVLPGTSDDVNIPPVNITGSTVTSNDITIPPDTQTGNSIPVVTCNDDITIPETSEISASTNQRPEVANNAQYGPGIPCNECEIPQTENGVAANNETITTLQDETELVNSADSEQNCVAPQVQRNFIRQQRLLRLFAGESPLPGEADHIESAQSTESDILSDLNQSDNLVNSSNSENINTTSPLLLENEIRVRIKFLNDTQLLVQAKLNEMVGEFKRRHFSTELANNKIVRLIFNGQLLRRDDQTVQQAGMFDNCVVHCQISQGGAPPSGRQSSASPSLDLSNFMMPLFAILLGLVWYARLHYRQLFNATSTLALVGITILFIVSVISVFIPHRDRGGARQL